jgi:hypothetical protein
MSQPINPNKVVVFSGAGVSAESGEILMGCGIIIKSVMWLRPVLGNPIQQWF